MFNKNEIQTIKNRIRNHSFYSWSRVARGGSSLDIYVVNKNTGEDLTANQVRTTFIEDWEN